MGCRPYRGYSKGSKKPANYGLLLVRAFPYLKISLLKNYPYTSPNIKFILHFSCVIVHFACHSRLMRTRHASTVSVSAQFCRLDFVILVARCKSFEQQLRPKFKGCHFRSDSGLVPGLHFKKLIGRKL